jgi:hypothetical protein
MSVSLFHGRRAERFAELVDGADGGRGHHTRSTNDERLHQLAGLAQRVSALPLSVEAHPEFREGLRAMLIATIEREGIGITATSGLDPDEDSFTTALARLEARRARRRTRALGTLVAGLAAGVIALSGMSTASEDSAPGDPLYGFKRSTERAQLALSGSDISRGQLFLDFAKTRLDEARTVRDDPAQFQKVMSEMDQETKEGVRLLTALAMERRDAEGLNVIDAFTASQRQAVERLRRELPAADGPSAETSATLLRRVSGRSEALRPLLTCGMATTGTADDLGPTPRLSCEGGQPVGKTTTGQQGQLPSPLPTTAPPETSSPSEKPRDTASASASTEPSPPAADSFGGELHGNPCDVVGCSPSQ